MVVLASAILALSGCAQDAGPPGGGPAAGGAFQGLEASTGELRIGDRYLYSAGNEGVLNVTIQPPGAVHDRSEVLRQALPVTFRVESRGPQSAPDVAFISMETGTVIAGLMGCARQNFPNGSSPCIDYWDLRFASEGSPAPFLLGAVDASALGNSTSLDFRVVENGKARGLTYEVTRAASMPKRLGECWALSPTAGLKSEEGFYAPVYWSLYASFVFCERSAAPVRVVTVGPPSFEFVLQDFTPGTETANVSFRPDRRSDDGMADGSFAAAATVPPEGERTVGPFPIREAFDYARGNDSGFSAYLEEHPDAVLRRSHAEANFSAWTSEVGPVPEGAFSQNINERSVDVGPPGSPEYYHVQVRKTRSTPGLDFFEVAESGLRRGVAENPDVSGTRHLTLSSGLEAADRLIPTDFWWVGVTTTVPPFSPKEIPLRDRFVYYYLFDGFKVAQAGGTEGTLAYMVFIESTGGHVLRILGPRSTVERFVPTSLATE